MSLVYLAGPIGAVTPEQAAMWRVNLGKLLAVRGVAAFDPAGGFHLNPKQLGERFISEKVQPVNDAAIRLSDVMVVAYQDAPSVGTDYEIRLAAELGKPTLVFALTSKNLAAWYVSRFGAYGYTPDEAIAAAYALDKLWFGSSVGDYRRLADFIESKKGCWSETGPE